MIFQLLSNITWHINDIIDSVNCRLKNKSWVRCTGIVSAMTEHHVLHCSYKCRSDSTMSPSEFEICQVVAWCPYESSQEQTESCLFIRAAWHERRRSSGGDSFSSQAHTGIIQHYSQLYARKKEECNIKGAIYWQWFKLST